MELNPIEWRVLNLRSLILPEREIHLWRASLDLPPGMRLRLERSLSPEEVTRARKFKFEREQHRFISARGILRSLLSAYIKCEPAELNFIYSAHGKPFLKAMPEIHFNLSHCEGSAVYAVARIIEVGVDVERIRAMPDMDNVARKFFSHAEYISLQSSHFSERKFFEIWTRKESLLKAAGEGLISASQIQNVGGEAFSFSPAAEYIGAVAAQKGFQYQFFQWEDEA